MTFANGYDRLDYFILRTIQEWQEEKPKIMGHPLIDFLFNSDQNRGLNDCLLCKTKEAIGIRLEYLRERGFIRLGAGGISDLRKQPFMFTVTLTSAGEDALNRGPRFKEAPVPMGNNSNITIGSLVANQVAVGDNARQNSTVDLSITLGQLLDTFEQAIEEADQTPEVKAEAKSAIQKFRENVATGAGLANLTTFAMNHLPSVTAWMQSHQ